jgi:hypothetical protein
VDDISTVEEQIYTISGSGTGAQLGALVKDSSGNLQYNCICNLGNLGWSQSYSGITAASWSAPLWGYSAPEPPFLRATFFLKTSTGDLLTAEVMGILTPATTFSGCLGIDPYRFTCTITKNAAAQKSEYTRTLGFDRVSNVKPYLIY